MLPVRLGPSAAPRRDPAPSRLRYRLTPALAAAAASGALVNFGVPVLVGAAAPPGR